MSAKELLDQGKLADAILDLNQSLKARPGDAHARVFLFELLCFAGEFDRAAKQLDVLATQSADAGRELALQLYRNLLTAERLRQQVFTGAALPKFLLPPPPSVEHYVVLLSKVQQNDPGVADLLAAAEDATPPLQGRVGEAAFAHFRDADDRVAPVLEAFFGADYLWLPFEQMKRLEIPKPTRLRETLWVPAVVEMHGHPPGGVFIPALYVNSHAHDNVQVRLGRMTEWTALADAVVTGAGQRVFLAGDTEHALLDTREVTFEAAPAASTPA